MVAEPDSEGRATAVRRGVGATVGWLDERLRLAEFSTRMLNHIFPDDWSFLLGEIALYAFVVLVGTGVFLTFHFIPSHADTVYQGSYRPLDGSHMSDAYASALSISFDIKSGLLFRQIHHWAADVFIAAIAVHMMRVYFTSAYRKPRDINWMVGVTMLWLAIVNGFLGYSLPDDLLSGTGVRIMASIVESVPFVGAYITTFFFQGRYPGSGVYIPRMYIIHVLIVPGLIATLLAVHLALIFRQKHTQYPKPNRTERNVVGSPMYPMFMARSIGLFLMVFGALTLLGGFVQIDPIWQLGPYHSYLASSTAQPDWYMGWIEGALRLSPSWEATFLGHTVPWMVFVPAVLLPVVTFGFFYLWPAVERKISRDPSRHHLLRRPRDRPLHTALGVAVFTFYAVLLLASSDDLIAYMLGLPLQPVVYALQALLGVAPVLAGLVAFGACRELRERDGGVPADALLELSDSRSYQVRPLETARRHEEPPIEPPIRIASDGSRWVAAEEPTAAG